jgi:hypothetical protein
MLASIPIRFLLSVLVLIALVTARWADGLGWGPLDKHVTQEARHDEWEDEFHNEPVRAVAGSYASSAPVPTLNSPDRSVSSKGLPHALVTQEEHGSADLSRHLQHRSLDQWRLADILVIGTIDGSLHARDRKTGMEMWTIPGERPLVKVASRGTLDEESDIIWIVEPLGDGALYYFKPSTGVKKLSVSIRQLIAGSPFSVEGDDRTYTGSTQTTLFTINASTGEIIKVYGAAKTGLGKPECRAKNIYFDYEDDEDEYLAQDNGIFKIGRTGEFK